MEDKFEQAQVEGLFAARAHMNDWTSGEELANRAKARYEERKGQIRRFLDDPHGTYCSKSEEQEANDDIE